MKRNRKSYFTRGEIMLRIVSVLLLIGTFSAGSRADPLSFCAALIWVTSLLFNAKGNPVGQALMLLFSVLYGIISYRFSYYGEMITYLGMTAPMALLALIAWLRHPFEGNRAQVRIRHLHGKEICLLGILSVIVTAAFAYLLYILRTPNLLPSTVSITTSFVAAYLTARRSPFFALAYAANDVVLIVLWTLASVDERTYLSVVLCFVLFLFYDLYGFFNWRRMEKQQTSNVTATEKGCADTGQLV